MSVEEFRSKLTSLGGNDIRFMWEWIDNGGRVRERRLMPDEDMHEAVKRGCCEVLGPNRWKQVLVKRER